MILEVVSVIISLLGIFGIGYFIKSLVIDPVWELRRVKVDIEEHLIYYGNVIHSGVNDQDTVTEASNTLRQDASRLESRANDVLCYRLWSSLGIIPNRDNVTEAKRNLIGISNLVHYVNSQSINSFDPVIEIHNLEIEIKILLGIDD